MGFSNTGSLDSASGLTFGGIGGTFNMDNSGAGGARSQDLGALTFSAGDGTVLQTRTAAQNQLLTFSSLAARATGATGNIFSGGTLGASNGVALTGQSAGFIDKGIFYGTSSTQFDHYAWYDGAGFVRAMVYGSDAGAVTSGATTTLASATHQQITGAISAQETATFSTLKINGANHVTLAADQTVTVDGILKAGNNAATISGGTGIQAANNAELVIRTDRSSDALTISTSILANGTNALTKTGLGTLTLSGANNAYSGGMTLNAGTLRLGHNSALGSGTFTINGGTLNDNGNTFVASTNVPIVLNGDFSKADNQGRVINLGTGDVTLNTPITISLTHPIQFGGTVSGPGGLNALDITPNGTNNSQVILGAGITLRDTQTVTTIGSAGRLVLNGVLSDGGNGYGFIVNGSGSTGGVTLGNVTHTFTGPVTLQNNGGLGVIGNISPSAITIGSGSTLTLGDGDLGTTGTISGLTTLVNNGTFRFGQNRTLIQGTDFPNLISGSGGLTKGNHGTIVLNAQNTFTGSVTVSGNSGGFAIGADSVGTVGNITSGPLGRGTLVINGQTVSSDSTTARTILNPVTFGGNVTLGNSTNNGKLTFEAPWTLNGNYTITTASAVEYNNDLNASTRNLTKSGSARLDLNGATTLANLTVTGSGTLGVGSGGSLSVGSGSGSALNVAVSNSGTLDVSASESFTANVGNFLVGTGGGDNSTGFAYLGLDNDITAATTVRVGANGTNEKGTLTTAADSTTIIRTPIMTVGGIGALGQGTVTHGEDAALTLEGLGGGRAQLVIGQNTANGTSGSWSYVGNVDLSAGSASLKLSSLVVGQMTATGSGNYRGVGTLTMGDNAANHLDISGAGSVVRIGDNAGAQNNTAGTVTIGNIGDTSSITSTDNSTAILIANKGGSGTVSGTLNLNGGTMTITTAGAAIAGGGGTSTLNLDGGATLVAGASSSNWINGLTTAEIKSGGATINTNGNNIGISQAFSGAGGLTKDGDGSLTLDGSNTYAGATLVSAGTLFVSGALENSAVTVGSNGTIGGNGTLGSTLTMFAGAKLDLTGATIDLLGSSNILSVASGQSITLNDFAFADILGWNWLDAEAGTYTLINGGGTVTFGGSTPTSSNPYDFGNGKQGYFQQGSLQVVIIPEPAAILLGGMGTLLLLRRRRAWK